MSIKTSLASNKWKIHFKYQSSLNIIILNVRSNVLFSNFIDVLLNLNYLHLNSNYSIFVEVNICIILVVVVKFNFWYTTRSGKVVQFNYVKSSVDGVL